jgi:hypothetical protein
VTLEINTARHLMAAPVPLELVQGMAWAGCITLLVGESGAGKSFVLDAVAAAVSEGRPCFGRATLQKSVLKVACESDHLGRRYIALAESQGYDLENVYAGRLQVALSRRGEDIADGERVLIDAIIRLNGQLEASRKPPLGLIEVDTVRASMGGSEDSSEDVSSYLRAIRRILAATPGAAALLAHHAGWQDGDTKRRRERGSSAWRGNVDATLYLEGDRDEKIPGLYALRLQTLKVRDSERPEPLHLIRRCVQISGEDSHGGRLSSCVVERDVFWQQGLDAGRSAREGLIDLRTLTVIAERPDLSINLESLKNALRMRKAAIGDSVRRLLESGFIESGRRNQPYSISTAGSAHLSRQTVPNGFKRFRETIAAGSPVPPFRDREPQAAPESEIVAANPYSTGQGPPSK